MNDLQWSREGHDHGQVLARDLGYTPVYLHYNSGRHISTNGHEFADVMEMLLRNWPHAIKQLAIVGHSMGGLVARSACYYATLAGYAWPKRLDHLVFLGTPPSRWHTPAPGPIFWSESAPTPAPFARLSKIRSAGIKDLRHGYVRDEDWHASAAASTRIARTPPFPLPTGVR